MNGVPGSMSLREQFYLTNASSITSLQNAIDSFLRTQAGVEDVQFIAGGGGGPNTLCPSEESLFRSGGMDCREGHSEAVLAA
jgi:hypothetical protein